MSRMLWVWVFRCLEGVHREIALQRPLLAAPQGYLRSQSAGALTSLGNTPTRPEPYFQRDRAARERQRPAAALLFSRIESGGEMVSGVQADPCQQSFRDHRITARCTDAST